MRSKLAAHDTKVGYELAVAQRFVDILWKEGQIITVDRCGDHLKHEPDVICMTPQGPLGLEITRDTFQASESKYILGNLSSEDNIRLASSIAQVGEVLKRQHIPFKNMRAGFAQRLQCVLNKHATRAYSVEPTYIIVDGTWSPFVVTDHAQYFLDRLCLSDSSTSAKAFLILPHWGASACDAFELARCSELRTRLAQQAEKLLSVEDAPAFWTMAVSGEMISPSLTNYMVQLKVKPWDQRQPNNQTILVTIDGVGRTQYGVVGMAVWNDERRDAILGGNDISGADETRRYSTSDELREIIEMFARRKWGE